jgi:hypothetical protein
MSNIENVYDLEQDKSLNGLKFFFVSKGEQDIIKVVQYSFIQVLNGKSIYNLGFGDYDLENDLIVDNINTNNGDVYKVFNTILSTIPIFFKNYSNDVLMILGSDGRPEFLENCKVMCKKKCIDECKNYNRRLKIYRGYVDKNYDKLSADYQFLGGLKNQNLEIFLQPYERHKLYDSVFLFRKNVIL